MLSTKIALSVLGGFLIFFTLRDVVYTALLPRSGSLSGRLTALLWHGALWLHWRARSHRALTVAGILLPLTTVAVWVLLLWLGWSLVFLSGSPSVVFTQGGAPADALSVIYFAGYAVITLGNGDMRPVGGIWQLLTVLASMSGFFFFTLSITLLLSVVQAAVQGRGAAVYISSLGDTSTDLIARSWNGTDCRALLAHVTPLMSQLSAISQQHLAYPVLHYLHSSKRYNALVLQIAVLDEALGYLQHGVLEHAQLGRAELEPLERVIGAFLSTLDIGPSAALDAPPPTGALAELRQRGLPTVDETAFHGAFGVRAERRRLLLALVEKDGWSWRDVHRSPGDSPAPRDKRSEGELNHPYA